MNATYLLHGFTQSSASWGVLEGRLRGAASLDLPGHGTARAERPGFDDGVASLVARAGPGLWIGYSMGGRYALHVALEHPALVERLVLVGAHPGIKDPVARADRVRADRELAHRVEQVGVERFVEEWLAQPLFRELPIHARGREARLTNTAAGLAASLRLASTGVQAPLWERLAELDMPVLYVAGERDRKYRAVGEELVRRVGERGRLAVVAGVGHAVPFEAPDAFVDCLAAWNPEAVAGGVPQ